MNNDKDTLFSFLPRELFLLIRDSIYYGGSGHDCDSMKDLIPHKEAINLEIIQEHWILENYKYNDVDLERFSKNGFFYGRINGYDTLPWYMNTFKHRDDGIPAIIHGEINWFNVFNVNFDGDEINIMEDYSTDEDIPELVSGIPC
jgi:hypothetical protein